MITLSKIILCNTGIIKSEYHNNDTLAGLCFSNCIPRKCFAIIMEQLGITLACIHDGMNSVKDERN